MTLVHVMTPHWRNMRCLLWGFWRILTCCKGTTIYNIFSIFGVACGWSHVTLQRCHSNSILCVNLIHDHSDTQQLAWQRYAISRYYYLTKVPLSVWYLHLFLQIWFRILQCQTLYWLHVLAKSCLSPWHNDQYTRIEFGFWWHYVKYLCARI